MASKPYVALGDSFAAGIGAGSPRNGRTKSGYPVKLANSLALDLAYRAVIGATVRDVLNDQVQAVGKETELVTITVGGNDVGFAPALVAAAKPDWLSNLDEVLREGRRALHEDLPGRLDTLFSTVRQQAPDAEVIVTGYPHLFGADPDNCPFTFFSSDDMRLLNDADDELNRVIQEACDRHGVKFVDVRAEFRGHEVFAQDNWLNSLSWPMENSYHPNEAGHEAYAKAVLDGLAPAGDATRTRPQGSVEIDEGAQTRGSAPTFALRDFATGANSPTRFVREARRASGRDR